MSLTHDQLLGIKGLAHTRSFMYSYTFYFKDMLILSQLLIHLVQQFWSYYCYIFLSSVEDQ